MASVPPRDPAASPEQEAARLRSLVPAGKWHEPKCYDHDRQFYCQQEEDAFDLEHGTRSHCNCWCHRWSQPGWNR